MVNKFDMSLADIIKSQKKPRGAAQRRSGIRQQRFKSKRPQNVKRNGGTASANTSKEIFTKKKTLTFAAKKMMITGLNSGPAKILVSNLDFGVTEQDIRNLFSELGKLKKTSLHFNKQGKSLGSAEVIFNRRLDALKAIKEYHNVNLDGRPMHIQLISSEMAMQPLKELLQSKTATPVGGRGRNRGAVRRQNGSAPASARRKRRGQNKVPTVEELNAELDSYKMEIN